MKKSLAKRWLAILCAIIILPWGLCVGMAPEKVEAADTIPTSLEQWTIEDAGMADGTYTSISAVGLSGQLSGTAFVTNLKFDDTIASKYALLIGGSTDYLILQPQSETMLQFAYVKDGANSRVEGWNFRVNDSRNVERVNASDLGLSTFKNQSLKLALTFEPVSGSTDKVSLGIWFNDTLWSKDTMTVNNAKFVKGLRATPGSAQVYLATPAELKKAFPDTLEKWTIQDAGMADGTYTSISTTGLSGQLVGSTFITELKYDDTIASKYALLIGGSTDYLILQPQSETMLQFAYVKNGANSRVEGWNFKVNDSRNVERVNASDLGYNTFKNQDLKLALTFEPISGSTDTALLGIWFNDALWSKGIINVNNTKFVKGLRATPGSAQIYLATPEDLKNPEPETIPESLTKWTIEDAGLADGIYGTFSGTGLEGPMVGSAFVTDVKFDTEGTKDVLYIGTAANQLAFQMQSETMLQIGFQRNGAWAAIDGFNTTITSTRTVERIQASDLGLTTFKDKEFRLTLTYEEIEGSTDTVLLGIWFDDALWREKFVMTGSSTELIKGIHGLVGDGTGNTYLATPEDLKQPEPETIPENLTKWTIQDAGLKDGVYGTFSGAGVEGPMVGSAFVTNVKFDIEGTKDVLYVGTNTNRLAFQMQSETMLQIGFAVNGAWSRIEGFNTKINDNRNVERINASDLGLTTFKNQELKLALTYEAIEGRTDAVLLGIWFNDTLWREKFVMTGSSTELVKGISGVVGDGTGNTYLATPEDLKKPEEEPEKVPENLEKWTIATGRLEEGIYGTFNGKNLTGSLVGTAFTTMVKFDTEGNADTLYIGTSKNQLAFSYVANAGALQVSTIKNGGWSRIEGFNTEVNATRNVERILPSAIGITTFKDTEVKLTVTFEAIEGSNDTVLLGIWFNDELYREKFVMNATAKELLKAISGVAGANEEGNTYLAVPEGEDKNFPQLEQMPTNLTKWTIATANMKDGYYGTFTSGAWLTDTAVNTMFTTMIKFDTEDAKDALYIGTDKNRLVFQAQSEDMLQIGYFRNNAWGAIDGFNTDIIVKDGVVKRNVERINASDLDLTTFKDQELRLTVTYEAILGSKDTVLVGIWFNDTLYREKFVMGATKEDLRQGISGVVGKDAKTGKEDAPNTYLGLPEGEEGIPPFDFTEFGFTRNYLKELMLLDKLKKLGIVKK